MPPISSTPRPATLARLSAEYAQVRAELAHLGYILQGSIIERRIPCGKALCACTTDPQAWHGPYIQWSRKTHGRTVSTYLTPEQAVICRQWIDNNRKLEATLTRMRNLSRRIARAYHLPKL